MPIAPLHDVDPDHNAARYCGIIQMKKDWRRDFIQAKRTAYHDGASANIKF